LFTLDATTIDLCLEVFPWAKFRKTKGAIKMYTLFSHSGYFPSVVVVTDGKVHDSKIAKELPSDALQADSIILVDKAYIDFSWLYSLSQNKCFFVTRAKNNMDYALIGQHTPPCPEKGLIADEIIELAGYYTCRKYPKRMRMVTYLDKETGKTYQFITNNFDLSPFTIARLYKERWQVELFYKWIKQNLKIKSFFGNTKNAVMSQIWAAMVYYLLLCYIKFQSRYKNSLLYLSRIIRETLMERASLIDLLKLKVESVARIKNMIQLCLGF
jgi:transposase